MIISGYENKITRGSLDSFEAVNPFSLEYDEKQYDLFTDEELLAAAGSTLVWDCESYKNYFLVAFKSPSLKKIVYLEAHEGEVINTHKLLWICQNFCIVGFNSNSYDIPVVTEALLGSEPDQIKILGNQIIYNNARLKEIEELIGIRHKIDDFKLPKFDHIDLIEVAPLKASLKAYAGRLHCERMQELDLDPEKVLTPHEKKVVRHYCFNDLDNTALLFDKLKEQLELRTKMSIEFNYDLRSKSDAQMAEAVIGQELKKLTGYYPKRGEFKAGVCYKYPIPKFVHFEMPELQAILKTVENAWFHVDESGAPVMPAELSGLSVHIGECDYKLGIGGLHSSETCISHKADEDTLLIDKDVASYYPSIILNLGLFPQHLGRNFLKAYRNIVNRRLEAKRTGDKVVNESLKITINGSFGKLGNKYSIMYSPDNIIQVTMTGQLALLMLIETLEKCGIPVVSANTDGVLIKCPKEMYNRMEAAIIYWENLTGFKTEETRYKATYNRDVNNYIAVKEDNTVKVKGTYAERGSSGNSVLSKNPENLIVADSILAFLTNGTSISSTIHGCNDIRRFVTVRSVKGGGEKSGVYLGKTVRWYYSNRTQGTINYKKNGNKVPNTDNAMPCMELPKELPDDIDYDRYIKLAEEALHEIGYYSKGRSSNGRLF